LRISPMRRAARSLMVTAVVIALSRGQRHTQFIWYPALSIVKCVVTRNQMDKD
jgi:hypothetical protein